MKKTSQPSQTELLKSNERVFICGKTGSGKTFLARHLTRNLKRMIVLDGKGTLTDWDLQPWDRYARDLLKNQDPVRARVLWDIGQDPDEFWSDVMTQCYSAGDCTLYIDEVYAIVPPMTKVPDILWALYTRGRELGIGVWAATQRPKNVPMVCMSEAEHYFSFRLMLEDDRSRMSEFMGPDVQAPIADEHGFYYMRPEWDRPRYIPRYQTKGG
jgi:energy-coupling factor transporter ATP-binding protein EcfA2